MMLMAISITKEETTTNFAEATYHLCGSALAPVYGGFGANFRVKWFDLGLNFNYQIGGKTYDSTYASLMGSPYDGNVGKNFHKDIYKAWTPENPNSDIPRFQYGDQYVNGSSDRWLTNASYLSLQNINFGFTLPEKPGSEALPQVAPSLPQCRQRGSVVKAQGS